MEAAFDESDDECVIHTALYILACTSQSSSSFVGDICFSPHSNENRRKNHGVDKNRYKWKPHTEWQIYRILVHNSKIYLDVLRALPTLRGALSRFSSILWRGAVRWTWNYCAFIADTYKKNDSIRKEQIAWKKVYTTTDDLYIPYMGHDFALTLRQQIMEEDKYERAKGRILANIGHQSPWLNTYCPEEYPYLDAINSQTHLEKLDLFRLYEFVFYVCLENCHTNTPNIGVVFSRDSISQRPLIFEIKSKELFVQQTLKIFQPTEYAAAPPRLVHNSLDTSCIGPIAICKGNDENKTKLRQNEAVQNNNPLGLAGNSLAEILKNCRFCQPTAFEGDSSTIFSGGELSSRFETSSLMHLSVYSPSYKQNQ